MEVYSPWMLKYINLAFNVAFKMLYLTMFCVLLLNFVP